MRRRNAILLGALVLLGSCMVCAKLPPPEAATTAPPAAAATNTPTPPPPPTPTFEPLPTDTPAPVLVVTNAPPDPINGLSAEEVAYATRMADLMTEYSTWVMALSTRMGDASNNGSLIMDEDWKVEVAGLFVMLRSVDEQLRTISPPARFALAHQHIVTVADETDASIDDYILGLDTFDADALVRGVAHMTAAKEAMTEANVDISNAVK